MRLIVEHISKLTKLHRRQIYFNHLSIGANFLEACQREIHAMQS